MKKIFFILLVAATYPAARLDAQTVTTTTIKTVETIPDDNADGARSEIVINTEEGRQVVSIAKGADNPDGFSVNVSGFQIDFDGRRSSSPYKVRRVRKARAIEFHAPSIRKNRFRGNMGMLEWGFNNFSSPDYSAYPPEEKGFLDLNVGRSLYVGWNIIRTSVPLDRAGRLGLSTGLGLVWRNFVFADNITLVRRDRMVRPEWIGRPTSKSKLTTLSLHVPLLLEFNFPEKMFLSAGVYGDVTLRSHTKYKRPIVKDRSGQYVNFFQAGATARFGFRQMYIFGNYGLTNFFEKDRGPNTAPYTIGFSILI